jgi:hypothetical protein
MRPYQQVVFQFSVHRQKELGAQPEHFEFLAMEASDPRREFIAFSFPPMRSVRSCIPRKPSIDKNQCRRQDDMRQAKTFATSSTANSLALECTQALRMASYEIRYTSSRTTGCISLLSPCTDKEVFIGLNIRHSSVARRRPSARSLVSVVEVRRDWSAARPS